MFRSRSQCVQEQRSGCGSVMCWLCIGTGSDIFDLRGVASAPGTMEQVSATGSSGLIFGVDFSSGETSAFQSNRGGGHGGGTKTFVLLNLDTLTQDNSTEKFFGPLAMKSQGFVACPDLISSTYVAEVERLVDVPFPYHLRESHFVFDSRISIWET